jgi:hypothetical protein
MLERKPRGSVGGVKHVTPFLEDFSGDGNGVQERRERTDGARTQLPPLHERRVELDETIGVQRRPSAGVEAGVVLHDHDGTLDRVQSRSARTQYLSGKGCGRAAAFDVP